MLREVGVGGRISGHGEKCGKWAKFAMIFEHAVEVNGLCLYLSQVSNLHKIDCDHVFAGVVNADGVGCRNLRPWLHICETCRPEKQHDWIIEADLGATFRHMQVLPLGASRERRATCSNAGNARRAHQSATPLPSKWAPVAWQGNALNAPCCTNNFHFLV